MRIRPGRDRRHVQRPPAGSPGTDQRTDRAAAPFQAQLAKADEAFGRAEEDALLASIDTAALALRRSRGPAQLEAYREAVRRFLSHALQQGYRVSESLRFTRHGHRVASVRVEVIDERLEALAREVLHGQADAIQIAAYLDEIRGLLLDLYG